MSEPASPPPTGRLSHRRAAGDAVVVTGAAGGIGLAIVRRLLADGWAVAATDVDSEALARRADELDHPPGLSLHHMDVADRASVDAVAAALAADGIGVAGLVNVAGLLQDVFTFLAMDDAQQRRIWDVNYFGAVNCTQAFGALMVAAGGGAIVNITSVNEHRPLPLFAYAPTKVALGALTTLTAAEFGPRGVRVNAIAPGFTLTPILQEKIRTGARDVSVIAAHTPMGRLLETAEIASVASFLLSDDASAVSGASIPVDAGWTAAAHWMNFRALAR